MMLIEKCMSLKTFYILWNVGLAIDYVLVLTGVYMKNPLLLPVKFLTVNFSPIVIGPFICSLIWENKNWLKSTVRITNAIYLSLFIIIVVGNLVLLFVAEEVVCKYAGIKTEDKMKVGGAVAGKAVTSSCHKALAYATPMFSTLLAFVPVWIYACCTMKSYVNQSETHMEFEDEEKN